MNLLDVLSFEGEQLAENISKITEHYKANPSDAVQRQMQKLFQLAAARSALSELRLNLSEEFCNRSKK